MLHLDNQQAVSQQQQLTYDDYENDHTMMARFMNDNPAEQYALFVRPDNGQLSTSRACTCYAYINATANIDTHVDGDDNDNSGVNGRSIGDGESYRFGDLDWDDEVSGHVVGL